MLLPSSHMLLDIDERGGYRLLAPYKEHELATPLGGKWDARNGWWLFDEFPEVLLHRDDVQVSDAALRKRNEELQRYGELISLHSAKDADVRYGAGLDPYQRVGVKFLATAGRAILADFPGAGKSAQAIRAACEVGAKTALVVTKKSLIHNWEKQFDLWLPEGYALDYDITNYEQLVRHPEKFKKKYDVMIVDEATQVKSRKAKRSKAVEKFAQKIPYVWLLSGTLVRNRPDELWMPLHILHPKRYTSYWRFVEEYCLTEHNPWSGGTSVVGLRPDKKEDLGRELAPLLLRRTRDVVDLPPITRETVYVQLQGAQKDLYHSMLREFFVMLGNAAIVHAPNVAAQLVRLRQIACTPALIGGKDVSAKTEALLDLLEEYAEEYKVIVFSTFARYVDNLFPKLLPYNPAKITGDVPARERNEAVEKFNSDPDCRVLVGSIAAMGEGLNIQAGDIIIFADKPWVADDVEQAESRSHRRGRKDPVHVISLVAEGTVDEYIEKVLADKKKISREIDAIAQIVKLMRERRDAA